MENKFNSQILVYFQLYIIGLGIVMPIWLYLISLIKYHDVGLSIVLILMYFSVMLISWASMQKIKNKLKSYYVLYVVGIFMQITCIVYILKYNTYNVEIIAHIFTLIIITIFMSYICRVKLPKYDDKKNKIVGKIFQKYLIIIGMLTYIPAYAVIKFNNKQIKYLLNNTDFTHNFIPQEVWHRLIITKLILVIIICYSLILMFITYRKTVAGVNSNLSR